MCVIVRLQIVLCGVCRYCERWQHLHDININKRGQSAGSWELGRDDCQISVCCSAVCLHLIATVRDAGERMLTVRR